MVSVVFYLLLIMALIYWVEAPNLNISNSLIIRKNPATELEEWLKRFQAGTRQDLSGSMRLPQYKFYGEVVEILLNLARKMGGNYQEPMLFLREGLQADRQFEKKLKEMVLGTWLQMGLMVALTWAFILGALSMVDVQVSTGKLILIFLWQGLGLAHLPFLLAFCRKRYFADIGKLWRMLYVLNSLCKVPLSRTEVLTIAGVTGLKEIKQKSVLHISDKLRETCQRALQQGGSYESEVKNLMTELRFQEKWHFELFEKRLTVIKLALLSIFFLPAYLAFIFLLLGDLLKLM